MASDEWITFSEAAGLIKDRLGGSEGRSEAVLKEARASGEIRIQEPLILNDDGIVAMRRTQIGVRRFSRDDLTDWLARNVPSNAAVPSEPQKRGGKKRDRAQAAASAIWGSAGPPDHLTNKVICIEVRRHGEFKDTDNKTILRAVGRAG